MCSAPHSTGPPSSVGNVCAVNEMWHIKHTLSFSSLSLTHTHTHTHTHTQCISDRACVCVSYLSLLANAMDVCSLFGNPTTTTTTTHAGWPATRSRFSCPRSPPSDYISNGHNGFHRSLFIARRSPFQYISSSPRLRRTALFVAVLRATLIIIP
jgi:hypothetical protein